MNLMINLIMAVTCYPILLILYYIYKDAGDKNSYCFGATLKKELRNDEAVQAIKVAYKVKLKRTCIILAVLPIPAFWLSSFSIIFTIWMLWILAICFVPMVYIACANKQIVELKQERGWQEESTVAYVDLKTATVPGRVKLYMFLPMLVLSTIPIFISFFLFDGYGYRVFSWMVVIFGICTYLFYICAVWTDKQRVNVICEDSDTNMNFARAKKQLWKRFWVVCAWVNTIFTWFVLLVMWKREIAFAGILWGTILYCILVVGATLWLLKKLLEVNRRYEDKKTLSDAADDDKYWLWGMVYCNKNDRHYMVEDRLGTGTSVNLGHKGGLITNIIGIVALLSIPIMCIWMFMIEFTPMQTYIKDGVIICEHLSIEYEIPMEEIDSYSTLTELPKLKKVKGNGMEHLYSGTFEVYKVGMYEVFLNPQNGLFLKLTVDGQEYYISGPDDVTTEELLEAVEK